MQTSFRRAINGMTSLLWNQFQYSIQKHWIQPGKSLPFSQSNAISDGRFGKIALRINFEKVQKAKKLNLTYAA